jgi:alpha-maltose-1-phosphate synthase
VGALWARSADRIVVHGDGLRAQLPALARSRPVAEIPHGVEVAPAPLPVPAEPVVLLFGRLEPYKGIPVLVDAMRRVWEQRPAVRLLVAGRGPCAAQILAEPRIELLDRYITEAELPGLLRRATVAALPYTQASQSGAGLVTIAQGIPTVVTRTGALPDLAPDGSYVAPPGDARAFAERLLAVLDHDAAERARVLAHARARFAWPAVMERYVQLFRELAEAG